MTAVSENRSVTRQLALVISKESCEPIQGDHQIPPMSTEAGKDNLPSSRLKITVFWIWKEKDRAEPRRVSWGIIHDGALQEVSTNVQENPLSALIGAVKHELCCGPRVINSQPATSIEVVTQLFLGALENPRQEPLGVDPRLLTGRVKDFKVTDFLNEHYRPLLKRMIEGDIPQP